MKQIKIGVGAVNKMTVFFFLSGCCGSNNETKTKQIKTNIMYVKLCSLFVKKLSNWDYVSVIVLSSFDRYISSTDNLSQCQCDRKNPNFKKQKLIIITFGFKLRRCYSSKKMRGAINWNSTFVWQLLKK